MSDHLLKSFLSEAEKSGVTHLNPGRWVFERETGEHFFPISDGLSMKVYRTAAGDYAITCHDDGAGSGGEVDYAETLALAKANAESRAANGSWRELAIE